MFRVWLESWACKHIRSGTKCQDYKTLPKNTPATPLVYNSVNYKWLNDVLRFVCQKKYLITGPDWRETVSFVSLRPSVIKGKQNSLCQKSAKIVASVYSTRALSEPEKIKLVGIPCFSRWAACFVWCSFKARESIFLILRYAIVTITPEIHDHARSLPYFYGQCGREEPGYEVERGSRPHIPFAPLSGREWWRVNEWERAIKPRPHYAGGIWKQNNHSWQSRSQSFVPLDQRLENELWQHLSCNRSQTTSKCGKNKKVAHEAIAECVTDVLTTFWRPLWSITGQMHGNMESICFI